MRLKLSMASQCRPAPFRYHIFLEHTSTIYQAVDVAVDVLFWLDLVLTFFVGFKPSRSLNTEYDLRKIAKRYLRQWFIIDFVAVLPIDRIVNAAVSSDTDSKPHRIIFLSKMEVSNFKLSS